MINNINTNRLLQNLKIMPIAPIDKVTNNKQFLNQFNKNSQPETTFKQVLKKEIKKLSKNR